MTLRVSDYGPFHKPKDQKKLKEFIIEAAKVGTNNLQAILIDCLLRLAIIILFQQKSNLLTS